MSLGALRKIVPATYREYALIPEDGRRHELIEGELTVSPAPSPLHQLISRRFQFALMQQLELPGIAQVINAPVDVIFTDTTVVQPDLVIVRSSKKHLITQRAIECVPDLVVEIQSPSNRAYDAMVKRSLYARLGVPEYWLIDPQFGLVVCRSETKGVYDLEARFDRGDVLRSAEFPELTLPLTPLFAEP